MKRIETWGVVACAAAASLFLVACSDGGSSRRFVYVMSNNPQGNEIIAFAANEDGDLVPDATYLTGGLGTGTMEVSTATPQDGIDPLASQGSLAISRDHRFLFAVNAGDDRVSSFSVNFGKLALVDIAPSGGHFPNSLDSFQNILYVSNVGAPASGVPSNLRGFRIEKQGGLTPLPGASYGLSTPSAQPARVAFSPDGDRLTVTELTTNAITVFSVDTFTGRLTLLAVNASSGAGPFGSEFLADGTLLVSESQPNGIGSVSSYTLGADGVVSVVSASVSSGQSATCWLSLTPDQSFAYVSNTGPGTISLYQIVGGSQAFLLQRVASSLEGPGSGPIDLGVGNSTLYVLDGGIGAITILHIEADGTIMRRQAVTHPSLPTLGAQGLVVL